MGIIDSLSEALRFKETIFLKEESTLQEEYDALKKLNEEYPNNKMIKQKLYTVKKGLEGENEIAYQLKKSNIGMYVLRDVKLKYNDLTAQIDYVIITPVYTYYVECKNLIGNISVTDKGEFVREYNIDGKKIRKGMYSPLRQVEAQREVVRKIWEDSNSSIIKLFASKNFNYYRRVLVVAANQDTILNTNRAPKDMKYKVLRADSLVRQMEYDISHRDKDEIVESKNGMEKIAKSYLKICINENKDYYNYYINKYCKGVPERLKEMKKEKDTNGAIYSEAYKQQKQLEEVTEEEIKNILVEFRKNRAKQMNIPAYYIFTNKELEELIEVKPKTIEELRKSNILSEIKIRTHGNEIVNIFNERYV